MRWGATRAGLRRGAGAPALRRPDRPALQHRPRRRRHQGQLIAPQRRSALRLPAAAVAGHRRAARAFRGFAEPDALGALRGNLPRPVAAGRRRRRGRGAPPGGARPRRRTRPADRQRGRFLDRGLAVLARRAAPRSSTARATSPRRTPPTNGSRSTNCSSYADSIVRILRGMNIMHMHDLQTRQTIVRLLSSMASAKEIQQYLKRFSQLDAARFAVVKVGGAVLRDDLDALASSLAFLQEVGLTPIVIHGAGPQLDEELAAAGIEKQTVDGLRVTTPRSAGDRAPRVPAAEPASWSKRCRRSDARATSIVVAACSRPTTSTATRYGLVGEVKRVEPGADRGQPAGRFDPGDRQPRRNRRRADPQHQRRLRRQRAGARRCSRTRSSSSPAPAACSTATGKRDRFDQPVHRVRRT